MAVLGKAIQDAIKNVDLSNDDFAPLPAGIYTLRCSKTEVKDSASGRGQYIKCEFTVLGPKYEGRKVFVNFNVRHESAEAERIGQRDLRRFMEAGGHGPALADSDELVGLTVRATLTIEESKNPKFGPQNRVGKYEPLSGGAKSAPSKTQPSGENFSDAFSADNAEGGSDIPWA